MSWPDFLKYWRKQGWEDAGPETYAAAYQRFGGSFITHPDVLARLSGLLDLPLTFVARFDNGEVIGALPLWGKHIAGTKSAMRKSGRRDWVDMGNPEVILPLSRKHRFTLRYRVKFLSEKNREQLPAARALPYSIGLSKSYRNGEFSCKFKSNQRRKKRLLEEAGGRIHSLAALSSEEIAEAYIHLSRRRWNCNPEGYERLATTLETFRQYRAGHIVTLDEQPLAVQLLYYAESPDWVSFEYVNGGVEPEAKQLAPGIVLTYTNTAWAEEYAASKGKALRYSFGKMDEDYKQEWCNPVPVYQV